MGQNLKDKEETASQHLHRMLVPCFRATCSETHAALGREDVRGSKERWLQVTALGNAVSFRDAVWLLWVTWPGVQEGFCRDMKAAFAGRSA